MESGTDGLVQLYRNCKLKAARTVTRASEMKSGRRKKMLLDIKREIGKVEREIYLSLDFGTKSKGHPTLEKVVLAFFC